MLKSLEVSEKPATFAIAFKNKAFTKAKQLREGV